MKKPPVVVLTVTIAILALMLIYAYVSFHDDGTMFYLALIATLVLFAFIYLTICIDVSWHDVFQSKMFKIYSVSGAIVVALAIGSCMVFIDEYIAYTYVCIIAAIFINLIRDSALKVKNR